MAEVINWETDDSSNFKSIQNALKKNKLILFPTDTVYGIGGAPCDAVIEAMMALKGRSPEKKFPILAGTRTHVGQFTAEVPPRARILMARFWPGALSIVFPAKKELSGSLCASDDTVAVRIPAHRRLREMLSRIGPIVSSSANRSGKPATGRYEDLDEKILSGVEIAISDDAHSCNMSSTVASVDGDRVHVHRQGVIPPDLLAGPLHILFVCAGNTCRSPMAEAIARSEIVSFGELARVMSRGLMARGGSPASPASAAVCAEISIDLSGHTSASLSATDVARADIILSMENSQRMLLLALFPARRDRIFTLREYATRRPGPDIRDPIGADTETYRRCREEIRILVRKAMRRLLGQLQ